MLKILYAGCLGLFPAILSQFTVEMCAVANNCEQFTKNPYSGGSKSFKVIDVDKSKKTVASACYKQHVYTHLQPFSHYTSQYCQNDVFRAVPLFDAFVEREPPHPGARNFVTIN